jgi:hypothetical protein
MKKKVIRLTESDIEKLVTKILKEEEEGGSVSSADLGQKTKETGQELKKGGLAPKERETLNQAIQMLTSFFKQPGNQATGKAYNLFNKLKKELETVEPEDVNEESVSQNQQQAAGLALSAKRGETPVSRLKGPAKEMYDSMTEKQLEDFASTKHKGLPVRVDEAGGYDSPELGSQHSKDVMELIYNIYKNITDELETLNSMRYDILDDRLGRATSIFLRDIHSVMERYGKSWSDAEKRRVGGR